MNKIKKFKLVDGIVHDFQFASISEQQKKQLINLNISRFTISSSQINQVKRILELEGKTVEQLRAVRNSIVKWWGDSGDKYQRDDLYPVMSGVTAVIDEMMYRIGGVV